MNTQCKHPFVWPNGDCVDCGVLATTLPGCTAPTHIMVPRGLEKLIEQRQEILQALQDCLNWICNTTAATNHMAKEKFAVVKRAEFILEGSPFRPTLPAAGQAILMLVSLFPPDYCMGKSPQEIATAVLNRIETLSNTLRISGIPLPPENP